jgi:membrane protease subunit HflC
MQAYKSMIAENTTLVLSTDSDLFKFLKGMAPGGLVREPGEPRSDDGPAQVSRQE